jgi:hypothetical protein
MGWSTLQCGQTTRRSPTHVGFASTLHVRLTYGRTEGLDNVDDVLESFASSCYKAGSNCTLNSFKPNSVLNFTGPAALLSAIDTTLDSLYVKPVSILDLLIPATTNVRGLLLGAMYSMARWPNLAEHLAAAFNGNFTGIVNTTMQKVDAANAKRPDSSNFSEKVIFVIISSYAASYSPDDFLSAPIQSRATTRYPRRAASSSPKLCSKA